MEQPTADLEYEGSERPAPEEDLVPWGKLEERTALLFHVGEALRVVG